MLEHKYNSWLEELFKVGEQPYRQNQEALEYLKNLQGWYNKVIVAGGGWLCVGAAINPPIGLAGGIVTLTINELGIRVDRLVATIEELLKIEGITVTPSVKTDRGTIDLLVQTPDRRCFAFALKSKKDSRVKWREDRQDFFATSPGKGKMPVVKKWSDLTKTAQDLNTRTLALKKEKSYLLRGGKNIITKAIVLTSKTTVDPNNDSSLFVDFGQIKALRVHVGSYIYMIERAEILKFIAPVEKS